MVSGDSGEDGDGGDGGDDGDSVTVFVSLILALVFSSHLEDVRFATSSDTYALNCHRKPEHIEL